VHSAVTRWNELSCGQSTGLHYRHTCITLQAHICTAPTPPPPLPLPATFPTPSRSHPCPPLGLTSLHYTDRMALPPRSLPLSLSGLPASATADHFLPKLGLCCQRRLPHNSARSSPLLPSTMVATEPPQNNGSGNGRPGCRPVADIGAKARCQGASTTNIQGCPQPPAES
jgi:hypothetical protein